MIHCFYCRRPEDSLHDLDCPHNSRDTSGLFGEKVGDQHSKKAGFWRHILARVRGYPLPNESLSPESSALSEAAKSRVKDDVKYVFLASPYTRPNPNHNTNAAIKVADKLIELGFAPFVPLLTHFWDTVSPRSYEEWLVYDKAWLERCDVVFRFGDESSGADSEVAYAKSKGVPVVYSLIELLELRKKHGE